MTDENIINNPYLDIVDAAVLGNTSDAANSIESALKDKISAELENMTADIGADILDDDEDVDDDYQVLSRPRRDAKLERSELLSL